MKILIIEDEQIAANNLELLIKNISPTASILAKLESVRQSVNWLAIHQADLIFMDIQLSDGLSFEIFEQVEFKSPVIFTTAYDEYAVKAFKVNSIDYLLKPVSEEELKAALKKYSDIYMRSPNQDIRQLLSSLYQPKQYTSRFLVYAGAKMRSLKTDEIAFFYVSEKNCFCTTFDKKSYALDFTLDKLENILDPQKFFRTNRQFIINIEAIVDMVTVSKSRLKLTLNPAHDEEVVVSVNNIQAFKQWLSR